MTNPVHEVRRLGQSIWYDNMRRGLLTSGELQRLIDAGVTGLTSNPTIFEKAIAGSTDYDEALLDLARTSKGADETLEALVLEDIGGAADLLRPVYDSTNGADGFASLEVSPALANDTEGTIAEAERLFGALGRPNVMIKVPATPAGMPAIRRLIGEGINVNVTLIFSQEAYANVREAYVSGVEDLVSSGGEPSKVASVASFFVSRVDTAVDAQLEKATEEGRPELEELQGKAAIANAKVAYASFRETFGAGRFAPLRAKGARVQRPLWASTGTKNPAYSDVLYVETLIGPDTVNTMPPQTLTTFQEHGKAEFTLEQDMDEAKRHLESLEAAGISMKEVTDKLLAAGVKAFADSFDSLLGNIEGKRARLLARDSAAAGASLGDLQPDVQAALDELRANDIPARIWRRDHTVWKDDPTEIVGRLGWLSVDDTMANQVSNLEDFARGIRDAGFKHAVLLGMGGSSLGPEVLRQTFGSGPGYPELIVLDSTVPAWVRAVTEGVDPAKTLFIVSSKSGGTTEPNMLYRHFRSVVEKAVGAEHAGRSFIAITDPGTSLERLATAEGFRRVFRNAPDIGGRYAVLSYVGLVPAILLGMDAGKLLDRAGRLREGSDACVPCSENPGAWLGAVMGAAVKKGRDKVTLVTSPAIASFGLWAEQLIAESTGKEGKGIVPVANEPLLAPDRYGDDRLFIYLRLDGDDNVATDSGMQALAAAGHPTVRLGLEDRYDLGGEFFRWEFATAVAGRILGIHPFDQPNVQQAKDLAAELLAQYRSEGSLPTVDGSSDLRGLLSEARQGDYLAIMAYLHERPETDAALAELRAEVMERRRIATTLGYGPRFLHSTGQLHKGGPASGLFLQITAEPSADLPIPGEPQSFGILASAQAIGDLQALRSAGRRVVSVHLPADDPAEVRKLIAEIG